MTSSFPSILVSHSATFCISFSSVSGLYASFAFKILLLYSLKTRCICSILYSISSLAPASSSASPVRYRPFQLFFPIFQRLPVLYLIFQFLPYILNTANMLAHNTDLPSNIKILLCKLPFIPSVCPFSSYKISNKAFYYCSGSVPISAAFRKSILSFSSGMLIVIYVFTFHPPFLVFPPEYCLELLIPIPRPA